MLKNHTFWAAEALPKVRLEGTRPRSTSFFPMTLILVRVQGSPVIGFFQDIPSKNVWYSA